MRAINRKSSSSKLHPIIIPPKTHTNNHKTPQDVTENRQVIPKMLHKRTSRLKATPGRKVNMLRFHAVSIKAPVDKIKMKSKQAGKTEKPTCRNNSRYVQRCLNNS